MEIELAFTFFPRSVRSVNFVVSRQLLWVSIFTFRLLKEAALLAQLGLRFSTFA